MQEKRRGRRRQQKIAENPNPDYDPRMKLGPQLTVSRRLAPALTSAALAEERREAANRAVEFFFGPHRP